MGFRSCRRRRQVRRTGRIRLVDWHVELDPPDRLDAPERQARSTSAALGIGVVGRRSGRAADFLLGGGRTEALGSNNWVVDGTLTASGKPLLANDPHLGTRLPSTWYLAHMSARDFDVIGATLPGAPAVALGRNRFIAWGATNVAADVEDLVPRAPRRGRHARRISRRDGADAPSFRKRSRVKGARARAASTSASRATVRWCRTRSTPTTARRRARRRRPRRSSRSRSAGRRSTPTIRRSSSFLKLNEARNWTEFTDALRDFVVPSQNFVYADVDGHIGYYAPGRIPVRASGDGSRPARRAGPATRSGPAGCHSTSCRISSIRRIALDRHRQQSAGAGGLSAITSASSGRSRIARSASRTCCEARAEADARRLCPHPGRHACRCTRRRCCRCCSPTRARTTEPQRDAVELLRALERRCLRRQRGAGDFRAVVLRLVPTHRRRRSRSARDQGLPEPFFVRDAVSRPHADRSAGRGVVRRRQIAGCGDMRRRGDDGARIAPSRN